MTIKGETVIALLIVLFGVSVIIASSNYEMGSVQRMGPGYFPTILGVTLVILGLVLLSQMSNFAKTQDAFPYRAFFAITSGVIAFALLIENLGLIPSIVALVMLSVCGVNLSWFKNAILIAAVMSVLSYFVFIKGLSVPVSAFWW